MRISVPNALRKCDLPQSLFFVVQMQTYVRLGFSLSGTSVPFDHEI